MAKNSLFTKIFGSRNQRFIRQLDKLADKIEALEPQYQALKDDEFPAQTQALKDRINQGEALDSLLPEAFALVREASVRTLGMRHYHVQLIGGIVIHQGKISEMRTGEGKTLMCTLPAYLNALAGEGVHVVTVNDYLASRDAKWMEPLYNFLGMTVGIVIPSMTHEAKRAAYACDITYATNNELGFDYLRDNMAFSLDAKVQREPFYAIIDEVDSILIDEARTPLIISGQVDESPDVYNRVNKIVPFLERSTVEPDQKEISKAIMNKQSLPEPDGDFSVDEKSKQVFLTEQGMQHAEDLLKKNGLMAEDDSLYDSQHISLMHHVSAALKAHHLFEKDVDYIVKEGEIVIVDEFTGRTMEGRRWSDGLHQAVEAKENVPIQKENQTLASITFQNYFRLYPKLSGMTGTADTEAYEFQSIYNLEVIVIPTHKPMIRDDQGDLVYFSQKAKFEAIIEDIVDCHEKQQPVLVGTASIEVSEFLSHQLKQRKIKHNVLNAKQHEREALIVAEAGLPGAVTIATNMAGRGTDIVLGGNLSVEIENKGDISEAEKEQLTADWKVRHQQVLDNGGLRIIGTERHESRRIDNQLRGRAGRQGDPGSSRFYISLEDNLMRVFGQSRMMDNMKRFGMKEDEYIEHKWITRIIENAQRKVESHNFDIRKQLLEYDDVANDQRMVIYQQRADLLESDEIGDYILDTREEVFDNVIRQHIPLESVEEQWQIPQLERVLATEFGIEINITRILERDDELDDDGLTDKIHAQIERFFKEKEAMTGSEVMRNFEKAAYLNTLDQLWKEHLAQMDHLRQGVGLRSHAQKQPIQEYKRESFELFKDLLDKIKYETSRIIARVKVREEDDVAAMEHKEEQNVTFQHQSPNQPAQKEAEKVETFVRDGQKVGRNDPCPCGSGKKYKQCHGRLT
ncbi:preprotein translocase subunit SecA [Marinicella sp. S1101]|uniref:preprotein translocase subunit SecA n=1 Tax=Marinicella marina TaxID=2996016 RepID=UPI0022609FF4|nr:preprotein translocase subunit SecA [Marinicella marina]MCX7554573.1 preprotein translocase subunit SecA [Marinicella marina]MDJ1141043.1 preprotein translocase subunit SecA [Marinicella marina]